MSSDTRYITNPHASTPSDEQLAAQLVRRQPDAARAAEAAFQQLYQRHARPLLAFLAARVRRDQLDDVQQTIWLRVWQRTPARIEGGNFHAWFFRIARNYVIDLSRRKGAATGENPDGWLERRSASPLEGLIAAEESRLVGTCLKELDAEEARVVRDRFAGKPYRDICQRMDIPLARAYKLYHSAAHKLHKCVARATR